MISASVYTIATSNLTNVCCHLTLLLWIHLKTVAKVIFCDSFFNCIPILCPLLPKLPNLRTSVKVQVLPGEATCNSSWSVTDDDDRRQRAKHYWPPTLCVGGPVITLSEKKYF